MDYLCVCVGGGGMICCLPHRPCLSPTPASSYVYAVQIFKVPGVCNYGYVLLNRYENWNGIVIEFHIQLNFSGSNTFGTMKISSRGVVRANEC